MPKVLATKEGGGGGVWKKSYDCYYSSTGLRSGTLNYVNHFLARYNCYATFSVYVWQLCMHLFVSVSFRASTLYPNHGSPPFGVQYPVHPALPYQYFLLSSHLYPCSRRAHHTKSVSGDESVIDTAHQPYYLLLWISSQLPPVFLLLL